MLDHDEIFKKIVSSSHSAKKAGIPQGMIDIIEPMMAPLISGYISGLKEAEGIGNFTMSDEEKLRLVKSFIDNLWLTPNP